MKSGCKVESGMSSKFLLLGERHIEREFTTGRVLLLSSASRIDDRGGRDFLDRSRAATDHGQSQFLVENLEDAIHSLLAKG